MDVLANQLCIRYGTYMYMIIWQAMYQLILPLYQLTYTSLHYIPAVAIQLDTRKLQVHVSFKRMYTNCIRHAQSPVATVQSVYLCTVHCTVEYSTLYPMYCTLAKVLSRTYLLGGRFCSKAL